VAAGELRGWVFDSAGDATDGAEYAGEGVGRYKRWCERWWLGVKGGFCIGKGVLWVLGSENTDERRQYLCGNDRISLGSVHTYHLCTILTC
jgi:hypothetical protein